MPPLLRFLRSPWTWIIVALLVAAYAAAGFLLVPRLAADGVRAAFRDRYHRTATLGKVSFNPFTLEIEARDFAVVDADGGPLLAFDRLYVNLRFASLLLVAPDFKAIALDGPRVRLVRRADGRLNVLDLIPPPDPKADPHAPPPRLWINELTIRGGEATLVDEARGAARHATLKPISFALRDFSTRSEGNAYSLVARSTRDEGLEWHGTFGLQPLESKGQFVLRAIKAETIAELARELLPVGLSSGQLDLTGSYELAERGESLALRATVEQVTVTALGLRTAGESADWLQVPRVLVTGTTIDLGARSLAVGQVAIEQPHLFAARARDGSLNLAHAFAAPVPPAAAPAPAAASPPQPWTITVPDIRLSAAIVDFEDRVPATPAVFHLAPIEVGVRGFASPAAAPLGVELNASVNDNGRLAVKGSLTLEPLAGTFSVEAGALGLAALQPYLASTTALTLKGGTALCKGTLQLRAGGRIEFRGDAGIDDLRTVDNALGEDFVKWHRLRAAGIQAQSQPFALQIRELAADQPYARVIIGPNRVTNMRAMLAPEAKSAAGPPSAVPPAPPATVAVPTTATAAAGSRAALPIEIGLVRVNDGSMNFADLSIKPNFATGIQELNGTIKGLSGRPDARADVHLEGKVERYAPVTITGQVNYFAAVSHADVQMSFRNMELTAFSPYSGKFAGYRIDRGKLSIDLNYKVENRKLEGRHKLVVSQLELGERVDSPDATGLPVKLAVALLKDRDGVINLDLPVSGNLDDPEFSVGPVIWKLLVGLITKIVTSPFALLGSLFGAGEELAYVEFAPGSATLDAAARGKIATLAQALESRPALKLDVPLVAKPDTDRAAISAQRWQDQRREFAGRRLGARAAQPGAIEALLASPGDYRALLEEAYRSAFQHRAEIPAPAATAGAPAADPNTHAIAWLEEALRTRINVDPADLDELAKARAGAVQVALLERTGIDPGRVFIVTGQGSAAVPAAAADTGPVRLQLALH